jgi:hypothetical protein
VLPATIVSVAADYRLQPPVVLRMGEVGTRLLDRAVQTIPIRFCRCDISPVAPMPPVTSTGWLAAHDATCETHAYKLMLIVRRRRFPFPERRRR